jgi:predicted RNA-binding protein Jag
MKHRFVVVAAICACAALVLVSTVQTLAQEKKDAVNLTRYSGTIKVLDKDDKTFTIQTKTAGAGIQIKYTETTKFTYRNQPSSIDELKQGRRVIILLDPAQEKNLVALRIDIRELD